MINYDTYCGLYCGACSIILSQGKAGKDELATALQRGYNVADSAMRCHGCKSDLVFIGCQNCRIKNCAMEKGVEHCNLCPDYPCPDYDGLVKSSATMPHLKAVTQNLETIKEDGLSVWLDQQDEFWRCPDCRERHSWYATKCPSCGRELSNPREDV